MIFPACQLSPMCRSPCRSQTENRCGHPGRDRGRRCRAETKAGTAEGEAQVAGRGGEGWSFCPAPGYCDGCSSSSAHKRRGQRCLHRREKRCLGRAIDGRPQGDETVRAWSRRINYNPSGQEDPSGGVPKAVQATDSAQMNSGRDVPFCVSFYCLSIKGLRIHRWSPSVLLVASSHVKSILYLTLEPKLYRLQHNTIRNDTRP